MKKNLLLFICILMGITTHAEVYYLNNNLENDASNNTFKTFSEAFDASSANDTIYVIGSVHTYGDISLNNPRHIIGPGYFLEQNTETNASKLEAVFGKIIFEIGSEGSKIEGLSCSEDNNAYIEITSNDILVENCYIYREIYIQRYDDTNIESLMVTGCYLNSNSDRGFSFDSNFDGVLVNCVLSNNIVHGSVELPNGSNGVIMNNLFLHDEFKPGTLSSFEIHNNILISDDPGSVEMQPLPDAAVSHNISVSSLFGAENSNQEYVSVNNLFVGAEGYSTDGQYQLKEGENPAIAAANDGGDIGPFGGPEAYSLSGLPDIPRIYELSTGGFVTGDELPVHIKVKQ